MTTKTKGAPAGPAAAKTAKTKTARPAEPPPPGAEVQAAHAPKAARRRLSPAGGPARGRAEAAEAMARSMFFEGLPRPMLEQLAATTVWKFWPAGRLVFCRGDEASGFHLTVSGLVKIFVSAPNGRERVLHLCEPGTVFGEAAVFRPGGYPASAEAAVDSETLLFPQKEFRALTAANPDLAFAVIGVLAQRLNHLRELLEADLKGLAPRTAALLLSLPEVDGRVKLPAAKAQVALRLGATAESLSRVLTRLKAAGLVAEAKSGLRLLDRRRLQAAAEGELEL